MLSQRVAETTDHARPDVDALARQMFDLIGEALKGGETVKMTGFGTLQVRSRAERLGRNPRTGETYTIVPRQTVIFVPGGKLREALDIAAQKAEAGKAGDAKNTG
ncbi:hypothetical protein VE26_16035 [Devosia chinhatensis]|uniref:Integration host factor subunit alpha n=2 Tax=Devosia chinhatensis TaxID=429727 RepID=A0A0F5FGW3_9HYPH|nr:hypothetical protein VE26_16035 [Devosia chinhatensis]